MNLLWLQSGGCGGCTLSWLGSEHGPLFRLLADEGIDILWHPSLSEACLDDARELIARCADGREPSMCSASKARCCAGRAAAAASTASAAAPSR
jgi:Ni,Fe-hydrogenase I small subunit